jgi:hypothetical protein
MPKLDLSGYCGTEHYYRHSLVRSVVYTDGVKAMAEQAGAYWLIDAIATYQIHRRVTADPQLQCFQAWTLERHETGIRLCLRRDKGGSVVLFKSLPVTDFPRDDIPFDLWVEPGEVDDREVKVILLPQEH